MVQIPGKETIRKVLVTGGAGYVGSALVPSLLSKGYEVVVYDLYIYGEVFKGIENSGLTEIKADIRDREKLVDAAKGADAIIHLACISNDPSFELNPELGKTINFDAFYNVLEAARANSIKRLIYASTSSVYGLKPEKNVVEEATLEPLTDYSKYKAECEKVLKEEGEDIEWVTIRPATVCGYARRLRLDLVVNILTINGLVNRKIKIFGGNQLRPNLNIKDMARAYELLLTAPWKKLRHQTFNVGYQNMTVTEIAALAKKTVEKALGEKVELEIVPTNDNRSYHINSDKIKKALGFTPIYTVEEAIETLADAFRKGLLNDPLNNPLYHNIKRMQELKLK
ncbi:SDR family oxidoreductase [Candidatus Woesearchaeota archaeon]|nr:SDR family oxidoreductase [Candidatus Woesearchaeota archaeon]